MESRVNSAAATPLPFLTGASLARHFDFVAPSLKQTVGNVVSDFYNKFNSALHDLLGDDQWKAMDSIIPGLILGVIPDFEHLREMTTKLNRQPHDICIVSVTDEFEQSILERVQPMDLDKVGFMHLQVPMTDFAAAITPEALLAAAYSIRKLIEQNKSLYIHCKAGRARSASLVALYLCIFGEDHGVSFDSNSRLKGVIDYIKSKRGQVSLHEKSVENWEDLDNPKLGKLQRIQEAFNLHQQLVSSSQHDPMSLAKLIEKFNEHSLANNDTPKGDSALSSVEFKNWLLQLTSFKQLKIVANEAVSAKHTSISATVVSIFKSTHREQYIRELLKMIYSATSDDWYTTKGADNHPVNRLMLNSKMSEQDKVILAAFMSDIKKYYQTKTLTHEAVSSDMAPKI